MATERLAAGPTDPPNPPATATAPAATGAEETKPEATTPRPEAAEANEERGTVVAEADMPNEKPLMMTPEEEEAAAVEAALLASQELHGVAIVDDGKKKVRRRKSLAGILDKNYQNQRRRSMDHSVAFYPMGDAVADAQAYAKGGLDAGILAGKEAEAAAQAAAAKAAEIWMSKMSKMTIRRRKSLALKGEIFEPSGGIDKMPWHDSLHSPAGCDVEVDPDETGLYLGRGGAESILRVTSQYTVYGKVDSVDMSMTTH